MTHATGQPSHTRPNPTAQPKDRAGARACTIAFLHVCLPPAASPSPCAERWTGMSAPAISVVVRLPMDAPVVPVPVEHVLPGEAF